MKVLELFAGTRSIGKAFEKKGHRVFSVEWDKKHPDIDLYADIGKLESSEVIEKFGRPDVVWASPDCSSYSLAAISHHRNGIEPKTEYAKFCDAVNSHLMDLIEELDPRFYFIENPVGMMKNMPWLKTFLERTNGREFRITYCKYSDEWQDAEGNWHKPRKKPTNIFTNHPNPDFLPPCKNGDSCHEAAPRGSKTGTQGLKDSVERSRIPDRLCEHIVEICECPKPPKFPYQQHLFNSCNFNIGGSPAV